MKLLDEKEFKDYIEQNYKLILKTTSDQSEEIAATCDFCKRDVFLKMKLKWYSKDSYPQGYHPNFATFFLQCPSCDKLSFLQTVALLDKVVDVIHHKVYHYSHYRLYLLPTEEHRYEMKDIPLEYLSLRQTIQEAIYCLDNKQFIASAIMFRRGLQILAKNVLGASGKDLYKQLDWLKSNPNLLGINLTTIFHDNSDLIRKVGNQGAHPDDDITLHDFTEDDANSLHDLFLAITNEIFILPAKMKAMQEELKSRRKLK